MAEQEMKTPVVNDVAEKRKKMIKRIVVIVIVGLVIWFLYKRFMK